MQQFFDEFEDYVKKKYGQKHFFKTLLEESVKPLHDTLEGITDSQVLESIFGDLDTDKLQKTLNEFSIPGLGEMTKKKGLFGPEKESGLSKEAIPVFIKGIDKTVLDALSSNMSGKGGGIGGLLSGGGGLLAGAGVGAAAGLAGMGIFGALGSSFGEGDGFATLIKSEVETLLSIGEDMDMGQIAARMGLVSLGLVGLGIGLMKFSFGKGASILASTVDTFSQSLGNKPFATGIKDEVETLLSIGSDMDGYDALLAGGKFATIMLTLGTGLAAFAIGQGAAGVSGFVKLANEKISGKGLSQGIKDEVETLLSIGSDMDGYDALLAGGKFATIMLTLGTGLAAFSIGQAAIGVSGFIKLANEKISGKGFAQGIKDDVEILLSIGSAGTSEMLTKGATFTGLMTELGLGLAAFAGGKSASGVAEFISLTTQAITGKGFAQTIKDDVEILLSIGNLENLENTKKFTATMIALGSGLAVFAVGKGLEGGAATMDSIIGFFTKEQFTSRIVRETATLLSLGNDADLDKAKNFDAVMSTLAKGLLKISGADLAGSLLKLGSDTANWITGAESPLGALMTIAENGDKLVRGADAISTIADSLKELGKALSAGVDNFDFSKLAKNLGAAIPLFKGLATGGVVKTGWIGNIDFKGGLLDPELKFDEMVEAVSKMKHIVGKVSEHDPKSMSTSSQVKDKSDEFKSNSEELKKQKAENEKLLRELLNEAIEAIGGATLLGANQVSETILATAGSNGGSTSNVLINSGGGDDIRKWRNQAVDWMRR
jgi:hypothetical protein